ncbi:MAG: hypothetical protein GTN80_10615 [Nitrososphaeria archaeon]|nr:hypothetical protein [Nitrososphaeria archaeon]NIQ34071.1 hypothetical protein [Nitrososphaeria archaeon]
MIGVYILKRRKKLRLQDIFERHPNLNSDERDVIYHIYQKGGRVWESEVRRIFDLPKTSVWRLARRLEGMGIITVKKVGLQNRLELKGDFH